MRIYSRDLYRTFPQLEFRLLPPPHPTIIPLDWTNKTKIISF